MNKQNAAHSIFKAAGSAMGLTMAMQGLAMAGDTFEKLQSMADPDMNSDSSITIPSPAAEEVRLSFKKRVPEQQQEKMTALCALARDVIADPQAAGRFSANPNGYLAERGLDGAQLDLESKEVKTVLALGDERVRETARRGDTGEYLRLMEARGLLQFNSLTELSADTASVISEVATVVAVVVDPLTSCAPLVLVIAFVTSDGCSGLYNAKAINGLAGKSAAMLWGRAAAREMLLQYVAEKADKLAGEMAKLKSVKEKLISREQLRAVLESRMLQALEE